MRRKSGDILESNYSRRDIPVLLTVSARGMDREHAWYVIFPGGNLPQCSRKFRASVTCLRLSRARVWPRALRWNGYAAADELRLSALPSACVSPAHSLCSRRPHESSSGECGGGRAPRSPGSSASLRNDGGRKTPRQTPVEVALRGSARLCRPRSRVRLQASGRPTG